MSKELESLNYVWYNYYTEELSQDEVEQIEKHLNIVQDGLKRLEAIDKKRCGANVEKVFIDEFVPSEAIENSNPSEALECLNDIYRNGVFISEISFTKQHPTNISPETNKSISEQCETIKQALIKSQEQEKVLEIIKEKKVNVQLFIVRNYKDYADYITREPQYISEVPLTQEDFELLKRYF